MTRPIPERAVAFAAQLEGLRLTAYPDPATGGAPWTIGYGHTGPEVTPGLKINKAKALQYLRADLAVARARLEARIGEVVDELSEPQFCALLSFVLNLGANAGWTIWKVLKARRFAEVPAQMARFVNASGRPMKGLVNRRNAEIALWHEESADPVALPSSVTRVTETAPTPSNTKPLSKSKSFMTGLATFGLTAAAFVSDHIKPIIDAITPYAANSTTIAKVQSMLLTMAAGAAVATVVFMWLKRRREA